MRPFLLSLSSALCVLLLFLGGCGGPTEGRVSRAEEAARQGILLAGNGAEPSDLDPHTITGHPEGRIARALFEGLVAYHPQDLSPVPGAAESWEISEDGRAYTFHLRRDARWSNGDPVTARDFVYGWNRALSPGLAGQYAYFLHAIRNARAFNEGKVPDFGEVGVRALDDYTLEVMLEHPSAQFLYKIGMPVGYPVHRATIEKFGGMADRDTRWTRPGNLVGNGPYRLAAWEPNRIIRAVRNPYYWDTEGYRLEEIHFLPIESDQTEERMFRTGGLHITNTVPLNRIDIYKRSGDARLKMHPFLAVYYYKFNTTRAPFDDPRVRLAFAMTIDRGSIVRDILRAGQRPATSFTPPDMGGYTCRTGIPYDPEAARSLLAEAGYPGGANFPAVELLYNTLESHKTIAEAIQDMWKAELGVRVTLVNQEWKTYQANLNKLNYGIARAGWVGDYVDPGNFLECLLSDSGNNNTGFSDASFDALLHEADRTLDREQRFELFQQAEAILMREAPLAPIYVYTRVCLESPFLRREPNLLDYWFYKEMWLETPASE